MRGALGAVVIVALFVIIVLLVLILWQLLSGTSEIRDVDREQPKREETK